MVKIDITTATGKREIEGLLMFLRVMKEMTEPNTATLNVRSADSTGDSTFRVTGIAEHWHSPDMEEQEEIW